ncbi:MAG TPA: outer membrane beta-barrel protein [Desulfuromonadales bacterium]|nr:outer membrane beta-barrel protein [Desulfuromonadales bacterium]
MKRKLLSLLVALASLTLLTSVASAAGAPYPPMHPYFSIHVGGTWLQDANVDFDDPALFDDEIEFDNGYNVGGAFGYDYGLARLEIELAHRENDVDKIQVDLLDFKGDGDFSATSLMLNGYWDFETGSPVVPYIGGGLGFANVSANNVKFFDELGAVRYVDDDDNVFAYQLAAGIAFDLNPALTLDLGYRFFGTSDPDLKADPLLVDPPFNRFETEFDSHNVSLGLRMNF